MENLVSSDRPTMDSLGYPRDSVLPDWDMSHHDAVESVKRRWEIDVPPIARTYEHMKEDLTSLRKFLIRGMCLSRAAYNFRALIQRQNFSKNHEELKEFKLKMVEVLQFIVCGYKIRRSESSNFSVSEEIRSFLVDALYSQDWEAVESLILPITTACLTKAAVNDAVIIRAALLLSVLYLLLIALVDRGGGKIYSSGSLDFRSVYISILLFLGAHVWIKSRDVAPPSQQRPAPGLHRKKRVIEEGEHRGEIEYYGNFEVRFRPPVCKDKLHVSSHEVEEDAKIMQRIVAFYYGKNNGELTFREGAQVYHILPMSEEEQLCFSGTLDLKVKFKWVIERAKAVLAEFRVWESIDLGSQQDRGMPAGFNEAGDGFEYAPSDCTPVVGPEIQWTDHHIANDTLSGRVGGDASHLTMPGSSMGSLPETVTNIPVPVSATGAAASLPGEQLLEPQHQQESLQENQANNSSISVIPVDDHSLQRQLRELQGQLQLEQSRNQQLEARLQQQEAQSQQVEARSQQVEARSQQVEARSQQVEARSQQVEARSQQVEARSQQVEARSQQVEARSQQVEARSQQVEARSQQVEARSQQVEARSQQVEARSQQVEARSQQVEARSQQVEARSQQVEARSQQVEARSQQQQQLGSQDEVECLRGTEHAHKRSRTSLT